MDQKRFNYLITIHNKEDLIGRVIEGILSAYGENSHIYPILDGCTDNTEKQIDLTLEKHLRKSGKNPRVTKIFMPDVHEILSINEGLRKAPQDQPGYNIIIQDDVILADPDLEHKVTAVSQFVESRGKKLGMLAFRHGADLRIDDTKQKVAEINLIESCYGAGISGRPLLPNRLAQRTIVVRSPECIPTEVVSRVGVMEEKLAPYTYDNHDYSLRCVQQGFENYVFCTKFVSEVKWGGMRKSPNPGAMKILNRNNNYVYKTYRDYLLELEKNLPPEFDREFLVPNLRAYDSDREAQRIYRNAKDKLDQYSGVKPAKRFVNRAKRVIKDIYRGM
ncbi:MAG: glycosyltransferase [Bacteriovoracia bacterium]